MSGKFNKAARKHSKMYGEKYGRKCFNEGYKTVLREIRDMSIIMKLKFCYEILFKLKKGK